MAALAACALADYESSGAFDEDENDDTLGVDSKADDGVPGRLTYRSGCGDPIRTGTYVLHGDVVLPTGVAYGYYVTITDEKVVAIESIPPQTSEIIETRGIIFPGLIDGHSHVEYNHVPLADLGKRYGNRHQWPSATKYRALVKTPKNTVNAAGMQCEALRHGEARALVGGTTAIQGTPQTACARSLVRNIEGTNFCRDRIRQNVTDVAGFSRAYGGRPSFAASIKNDIALNKLDAFIVHAGEGIDERSRGEWDRLVAQELAVPELVVIHGTAFGEKELAHAATVGAKLIWSPLSNLLLYGKTTDVPTAVRHGVLVSLGADWAPSGSANLLGELKVADHVNRKLWGGYLTDEELVDMVTINPAITFGWDAYVGSIAAGKYADLMVVAPQPGKSPYRSLIEARPQDVLLVTISGDPLYGTPELMERLGKTGDYEVIDACGVPRAIDMTVSAKDVTKASTPLTTIESDLASVNHNLTPVIDCTDDEARKAYVGTPLE